MWELISGRTMEISNKPLRIHPLLWPCMNVSGVWTLDKLLQNAIRLIFCCCCVGVPSEKASFIQCKNFSHFYPKTIIKYRKVSQNLGCKLTTPPKIAIVFEYDAALLPNFFWKIEGVFFPVWCHLLQFLVKFFLGAALCVCFSPWGHKNASGERLRVKKIST